MTLRLLGLLMAAPLAAVCAQKKPVDIAAVAAAADASEPSIIWAPEGDRFVWIENGDVWGCDASNGKREKIADLRGPEARAVKGPRPVAFQWENRRVREQRLQWFPDGNRLLLYEGGDLFLWNFTAGQWVQLTATAAEERDPRPSPDGKHIAFRRDSDLYSLDIENGTTIRLTNDGTATVWNGKLDWVYPEELELGRAYWWSPDSRSIAYLQFDVSRELLHPHVDLLPPRAVFEPQRYPKAGTPNADVRLGVVSGAGGPTRWMDLGETRDSLLARVAWMPGAKSIVAQKLNRVQNRLDLLAVDVESGSSRVLLRESDPAWVNLNDTLEFLPGMRQFVWSSERSGFRHLYLYGVDGQLQRALTQGQWEVIKTEGIDPAGEWLYYTGAAAGPLERQLYRLRLPDGDSQRVTRAAGVHETSLSPSGRYYLDRHSSLIQPPRRTLYNTSGGGGTVFSNADAAAGETYELLPVEIVEVAGQQGPVLYARLIRPAGFRKGAKYPAVVFVYGGPHGQKILNSWMGLSWEQALAHRGFVVWQLDNRGTNGRGHAFETGLHRRLGAQELADQRRGLEHLLAMGFVDRARVGIYGWSYGGFMTLYAMLHASELFRAGIAGAPVTDWRNYDTIYTERYLGLPQENEEGYRLSSPVHFASQLKGALLLAHNFEDDNVLFQNTMQMVNALNEAGKQYELRVYAQKAHGVTGRARRHMWIGFVEFLERNLKN
jgi:dipeptidyl-peptidase-4